MKMLICILFLSIKEKKLFCEHQEQVIVTDGYDYNSKMITTCSITGKKCPFSKLKKAQKRCGMLIIIEEEENDTNLL